MHLNCYSKSQMPLSILALVFPLHVNSIMLIFNVGMALSSKMGEK